MVKWLNLSLFQGTTAIEFIYAACAASITYILVISILRFGTVRLEKFAARTTSHLDDVAVDVLKQTQRTTILIIALLVGAQFLTLSEKWEIRLDHLWFIVIAFQVALWVNQGITIWTHKRLTASSVSNPVITTMMSWGVRALLWSVLLLSMLANIGVNITAFVASLGVGGVAIALAVQSILSDLFASAAIGLDKPFEIGDFIVFNDVAGSIEHIGLKTTRIRSIGGQQIVCSNTELLKNTINNYKRMSQRRILFGFGLTYDSPSDKLRMVPGIVKEAVEAAGDTRFDRAHLKGFGDSSLDFEVVYFVTDPSYNLYMDVQQKINLTLIDEFSKCGLSFAFPTRTLYVTPSAETASTDSEDKDISLRKSVQR